MAQELCARCLHRRCEVEQLIQAHNLDFEGKIMEEIRIEGKTYWIVSKTETDAAFKVYSLVGQRKGRYVLVQRHDGGWFLMNWRRRGVTIAAGNARAWPLKEKAAA